MLLDEDVARSRRPRHAKVGAMLLIAAMVFAAAPGCAQDIHVAPVLAFFDANVRGWVSDPIIIAAIKAQNAADAHLTGAEISALDEQWRQEVNRPSRPLIDRVLATPLSAFLKHKEDQASGAITEIFVMDAKGLNVGESSITSDYWQGDEAKFQKTFDKGPSAVFVDDARKDESTQMLQSQVSMTIVDEHNKPIGAITVGVNLDQL
jgi:hypothetical protein